MSEPFVEVTATITDRWNRTEEVYAGSMPAWAWENPEHRKDWKKANRRYLLEDRTTDPRGWRVEFTATPIKEEE